MIEVSDKDNVKKVDSKDSNTVENNKEEKKNQDCEDSLETSLKSFESSSDDGLDQFKLRISDDDHMDKDGDPVTLEESSGMEIEKNHMQTEMVTNDEESTFESSSVKDDEKDNDDVTEDDKIVENGVNENVSDESDDNSQDINDKSQDQKILSGLEKDVADNCETSESSEQNGICSKDDEKLVNNSVEVFKDDSKFEENDSSLKTEELNGNTISSDRTVDQPSDTSVSKDSEVVNPSETPPVEPAEVVDQTDEESQQSTNSTVLAELTDTSLKNRKRPRTDEDDDITTSGSKKIRVDKRHCSDGEQETDNSTPAKKERRGSLSESDLVKDLKSYSHKQVSDIVKDEKWKPNELTDEEKKQLEQSSVREKKMRENVLRVIQRNYKNMSVEDFEDAIYVAMMDYFCHYNPSSALQRKVVMLEKLVLKLQENYNRTFKQFCEAKYLLRRMVEIRKEDSKKCICKDKLPFKLIRSVAVQVQTSRCRGGDLCPGTGVGLDPKFKAPSSSSKNSNTTKKNVQDQNQSSSNDDVSGGNKGKDSVSETARSDLSNGSDPTPASERSRHISVSVPPPPIPVPRWTTTSKSISNPNKSPTVRTRPQSELQNKVASPTSSPQTSPQNNQRTLRTSPSRSPSLPPPPKPSTPSKTNQSVVIDLTDKDDDPLGTGKNTNVRVNQAPKSPAQATTTPQSTTTRVVKTSVLSPMPQLPPLPAAPLYKSIVKRPPQPVLKVCKADQSGIMLSWTLRTNTPLVNEISLYQVFACQENAGVTREWSTVGDVKALPLPMACTLSQFREGHRYHFVVRAVDKFKVFGEFSHPASILLVSKNGSTNHAITACSPNARH